MRTRVLFLVSAFDLPVIFALPAAFRARYSLRFGDRSRGNVQLRQTLLSRAWEAGFSELFLSGSGRRS